jgi:hypothetical protein
LVYHNRLPPIKNLKHKNKFLQYLFTLFLYILSSFRIKNQSNLNKKDYNFKENFLLFLGLNLDKVFIKRDRIHNNFRILFIILYCINHMIFYTLYILRFLLKTHKIHLNMSNMNFKDLYLLHKINIIFHFDKLNRIYYIIDKYFNYLDNILLNKTRNPTLFLEKCIYK